MLQNLHIQVCLHSRQNLEVSIENRPLAWLKLLHPFTAVKNLYLSEEFTPRIVHALQELVGGRTTEVLHALQNIFLEGFQLSEPIPPAKGIGQFIAAREEASHPIAISPWTSSGRDKLMVDRCPPPVIPFTSLSDCVSRECRCDSGFALSLRRVFQTQLRRYPYTSS
jgi:hypothetical protein